MKEGLENIDKIVKQAFEGFEGNVDPSVWGNIQSSMASGAGSIPAATSVVGKTLALKIVAGVIAVSSITTGAYFVLNDIENKEDSVEIAESNVTIEDSNEENKVVKATKELKVVEIITENEKQRVEENGVEENIIEEIISSENTSSNKDAPVIVNSGNEASENSQQEEEQSKKTINVQEPTKKESKKAVDKEVTAKKSSKEQEEVLRGTIQASVTKGIAPLDVFFDVVGENIVSYLWDFGDNSSTSSEASDFHTFNEPGKYKVELIILDKNANPKTLIKVIEVESSTKASLGFIQNSFSPNGDGHNDVYEFTSARNIKTFNAKILNVTNGSLIYEWNSIEGGWDGISISGEIMEKGSYVLSVIITGVDGEVLQEKLLIYLGK